MCALDQAHVSFDTGHAGAAPGQRKTEIAETAKKVERLLVIAWRQQLESQLDHFLVERPVHLDKIDRRKFQFQVESRQPVKQRVLPLYQGPHAVETTLLQVKPHLVAPGKLFQRRKIVRLRCIEDTQYQRRGIIRNRHFYLRYPLADAEPVD
ncbi:hypothetical protein MnTg04_00820 [bacterium MnTg04]|nr:hypothetical protein MnTg04_00820 [bacterium MnTg04]